MKKSITFLVSCMMSLFTLVSYGQKNIPETVLNHFKTNYPNARVMDWDKERNGYEVEFTLNGKKWEGYYDTGGKWMRAERDVSRNEVPKAVWAALAKSEYAAWRTDDIEEHQTLAHKSVYEMEVKNAGKKAYLYILPDGTFVK